MVALNKLSGLDSGGKNSVDNYGSIIINGADGVVRGASVVSCCVECDACDYVTGIYMMIMLVVFTVMITSTG